MSIQDEVNRNYDEFKKLLPSLLPLHRDRFALMKDGKILSFFSTMDDARTAATQFIPIKYIRFNKLATFPSTLDSIQVPSLSINYIPAVGPLLQVIVLAPSAGTQPTIPPPSFMALIDTGASHTAITSKVINQLNLNPIGKQPVGGVHGMQPTNLYSFQVGIPFPTGPVTAGGLVNANVVAFPVSGTEFISGGNFDVLLGRDVICQGVFTLSFDGHAILSI